MDNPVRVIFLMSGKLIKRIDDYRFSHRLPSRAEAIRQLIEAGLRQAREARVKPANDKSGG